MRDLPLAVLVRMRPDRVLVAPLRRTARALRGEPDLTTRPDTRLYGPSPGPHLNRLHPHLTHHTAWTTHIAWTTSIGNLPIIEGTVIRLEMARLPAGAIPSRPGWHSQPDLELVMVDPCWQAFLRRFDIEHTFHMLKQTLGWPTPEAPHTRTE